MKGLLKEIQEKKKMTELKRASRILQRTIELEQQELIKILETTDDWKKDNLQDLINCHKIQLDEINSTLDQQCFDWKKNLKLLAF